MSLQFRRHFKLVVLLGLVALVLILGFGDQRIIAYSIRGSEQAAQQSTAAGNDVTQFADTLADSIQVLISDAAWLVSDAQ